MYVCIWKEKAGVSEGGQFLFWGAASAKSRSHPTSSEFVTHSKLSRITRALGWWRRRWVQGSAVSFI